ncbi:hypothetical protein [Staphylococcus intermedius]|uniref:Uncharacterized protein n=1 Tax=Staphylococcus intermedius NCTC 11048 TaxID=1141106 RepID=A0A380G7S0_STAIN|nr:hypothetical protein [Staphylococcus intermedius]PCF64583.1 hypothetical protein B5C04_00640 [Staphylococcus intermedius]PCF80193.1 hypothetical protein B4W74_00655 [Staphylococcus intermedius]PCF81543.1 hypothetical protein B4W70_00640 [Staphylococcus intermedius]PCF84303.1 hypothetical protein B4W76_11695 [Staphylococcus intermedius]PCF86410.1 hypothetical protein B4W75_10670 [Staphylococcus intermedius]
MNTTQFIIYSENDVKKIAENIALFQKKEYGVDINAKEIIDELMNKGRCDIAYTELDNEEGEIQVYIDFKNFRLVREITFCELPFPMMIKEVQDLESIEEMILESESLNFDELVSCIVDYDELNIEELKSLTL